MRDIKVKKKRTRHEKKKPIKIMIITRKIIQRKVIIKYYDCL